MYYPVGCPQILDGRGATGGSPLQLIRHRTKNLIFELREHSLAVWHSRLHILLTSYKLSPANIKKHGINKCAVLKPDGTCIAISTSNRLLYFLHVVYSTTHTKSKWRYAYREHGIYRHTPGLELPSEGRLLEHVSLNLIHEAVVPSMTNVMAPVAGQLMIATSLGLIRRISWNGVFDGSLTIHLNNLLFANDRLPETRAQPLEGMESVVDISYSYELHGLAVAFSSGKVAFITGTTAKFEPQTLQGVWLRDTTDGVCVAINPRYNLIACGRSNGLVDTYCLDETSGAWNKLNTLQLSRLHFADSDQYQLGLVQCLEWSPHDYSVLAVAWYNGGLSMWSVFGSLLFHSLGNQPGTPTPLFRSQSTLLQSLTWSIDTYQLWLLPRGEHLFDQLSYHATANAHKDEEEQDTSDDKKDRVLVAGSHVVIINFVKSAFINNPVITNHDQLLLHSCDRLYLGPLSCNSQCNGNEGGGASRGYYSNGNHELNKTEGAPLWKIIQLPSNYLVLNWPLQYAAISPNSQYIVVTGKAGLIVYMIHRRKWKLFGSELQEQSIVCKGGVAWFDDIIVLPCRINGTDDQVLFFSIHHNLDVSKSLHVLKLHSAPVKLNVMGSYLLIAYRDSSVSLFRMKLSYTPDKTPSLNVDKLHVMSFMASISRPWAQTLISVVPSTIRTEPGPGNTGRLNSILLNISGRVIMVQREQPSNEEIELEDVQWGFSNPVSLAPSVEGIWTPPLNHTSSPSPNHLMESLWLACGAQGIKVWLPLYPRDEGHPTFLSKRIMLTLPSSSSFPQTVLFSEAIIVGVAHEPLHANHSLATPLYFPPTNVRRITRLFLNHVLRQLLKRNLGSHALQIARTHAHLSYFAHILELMLHEILEEEAPGSPIPDALLPRVIEFIKEFPHFYETVGSCARKTEVALWNYLFAAVGNPKDLFELCLVDSRLKTAATYLIIIQNLEPPAVSRHLATRLLDASLDNNQWELAKDLVRFLKRIGPSDVSPLSPVSSLPTPGTPYFMKSSKQSGGPSSLSSYSSPSCPIPPDLDQSVAMVTRDHLSSGNPSSVVSISGDYCDPSGKVIKRPHFALDVDTKEDFFIELILCRHARKLLTSACLIDLGLFAAHLDFDIYQWMSKERNRAASIDNYVQVLCDLHKQFHWPLPPSSVSTTPSSTTSHIRDRTEPLTDHINRTHNKPSNEAEKNDSPENSLEISKIGIKRLNRPPDLNIRATGSTVEVVEAKIHHNTLMSEEEEEEIQEVIVQSSTPSKGSHSFSSDNIVPQSSDQLYDSESLLDDDPSLWEEDISMTSAWTTSTKTVQSEQEIRYFVDASIKSFCLEWTVILGILLQDSTIFIHVSQLLDNLESNIVFPNGIDIKILTGISSLGEWAAKNSPGYLPFLSLITPILYQWQQALLKHAENSKVFIPEDTMNQPCDLSPDNIDSPLDVPITAPPAPSTAAHGSGVQETSTNNSQTQSDQSGGCVIA